MLVSLSFYDRNLFCESFDLTAQIYQFNQFNEYISHKRHDLLRAPDFRLRAHEVACQFIGWDSTADTRNSYQSAS